MTLGDFSTALCLLSLGDYQAYPQDKMLNQQSLPLNNIESCKDGLILESFFHCGSNLKKRCQIIIPRLSSFTVGFWCQTIHKKFLRRFDTIFGLKMMVMSRKNYFKIPRWPSELLLPSAKKSAQKG